MKQAKYTLPELPYGYNALAPYISEEQLRLHHDKHHQAYVNGANALLDKLVNARQAKNEIEVKAVARELSFNIGGHILHSLFWKNLQAYQKDKILPSGKIKEILEDEFGSFEVFKNEFTKAAQSVEGSGWAVLFFCKMLKRPIIGQVEKHNMHVLPLFPVLMVLDGWEHAYYVDYKNDKAKYIDAFWNIVNWETVNKRLEEL